MVAIMREADRDPVSAVAKRHGISEQTIYTWRKRFGGFQANDVRRLKHATDLPDASLLPRVRSRDPPGRWYLQIGFVQGHCRRMQRPDPDNAAAA